LVHWKGDEGDRIEKNRKFEKRFSQESSARIALQRVGKSPQGRSPAKGGQP